MSYENRRLLAGYIPIIDNGYLRTIERHHNNGSDLGVFETDIVREFAPYTRKELRALEPEKVCWILNSIGVRAFMLGRMDFQEMMADPSAHITLLNDDICRNLLSVTRPIHAEVKFESPFLRWDRDNIAAAQVVSPSAMVNSSELGTIFSELYLEAEKSSDWWRHVAAAIVSPHGETIALKHNTAVPTEQTVNIESDPRILSRRGSDIELSLFLHAEANCISAAAKEGKKLAGCSIYVTTFPCPNCAKMIAASGITSVYFTEGYAMLDGQRILTSNDVEIIKVKTETEPTVESSRFIPYPKK